jgi:hypothetical protein
MSKKCSLCLDAVDLNGQLAVLAKCGHSFHDLCIAGWVSRNKTCPQCHVPTTAGDVIKVHACQPTSSQGQEGAHANGAQPSVRHLYGQVALFSELTENQASEINHLRQKVRLFSLFFL